MRTQQQIIDMMKSLIDLYQDRKEKNEQAKIKLSKDDPTNTIGYYALTDQINMDIACSSILTTLINYIES